ncbi:hypothetical protein ANCCAN_13132 [Ancylostoma caninum]|uniref:Uncharacterized protein n=1 Tax=Ancylostoma caninum TaxID=29170 RepID=A0A368GD64_ANCCA|nr:hypothetical protein ANCCAN_13132 [Ancylostoma caninum]
MPMLRRIQQLAIGMLIRYFIKFSSNWKSFCQM